MNNFFKALLLIMVYGVTGEALGCLGPPREKIVSASELVKRSDSILLAKVVKLARQKGKTIYRFKVIEALKGKTTKSFSIVGEKPMEKFNSDFASHSDKKFWEVDSGRTTFRGDCTVLKTFNEGETYLIFPERPGHIKGFERITIDADEWLMAVRNELAKQ